MASTCRCGALLAPPKSAALGHRRRLPSSAMASRRRSPTTSRGDFAALAESMRTAADVIRSQAEVRYRDALARADGLEAAALQLRTFVAPADTTTRDVPAEPQRRARTRSGGGSRTKRPAARPSAATTRASTVSELPSSTITDRAVVLVAGSPRRTWTAGEVAASLNAERTSVSTFLARAVRDGKLRRVGRGAYQAIR
jgi:hypothetical protein